MQGLKEMLVEEQKYLERIADAARKSSLIVPEGRLRISKSKYNPRYYQCMEGGNEIYISRTEKELPKQLAQKDYNKAVIKKAETRLKQIQKIMQDYSDDEIEKIYTSMHKERQALVTPIEATWYQRIIMWYEEEYDGKEFREGTAVILTEKGERVRSKSEKILADSFYRKNILYKYEKPLHLKGYGIVYPDFTFLSRKKGKEIYWEHEGMMDRQEYARTAVKKIESYQTNHIYMGDRLILTFETEQCPLNFRIVENLIEKYLM